MERDEVILLPSGTEISVEAALGDIGRCQDALEGDDGLVADLEHVGELLLLLAAQ